MQARFSPFFRVIGLTMLLIAALLGLPSCASSDSQTDSSTPWTVVQAPESNSATASIIPGSR